ncbi:MAG: hypothetical protein R2939_14920 [Kofleriaceae bacterium]
MRPGLTDPTVVRTTTSPGGTLLTVRPATAAATNHGWLDSHHSFLRSASTTTRRMGLRALRVISEDRVAPGRGFGAHPHRDMEIAVVRPRRRPRPQGLDGHRLRSSAPATSSA